MKFNRLIDHVVVRNVLGLIALIAIHFVSDRYDMMGRSGIHKTSPYFFLILMYGWIAFHNRILFQGLFMKGRFTPYFIWTCFAMMLSSANMYFIIHSIYKINDALPHILSFWVYTIAGLGVFVVYNNLKKQPEDEAMASAEKRHAKEDTVLSFFIDGRIVNIAFADLLYIESLENYVKIFTASGSHVVRMSMKEAEQKLPSPGFIRISRSHIVNSKYVTYNGETLTIRDKEFRVGRVYKKYVQENLAR